jgi:magnesium-transporting ATPase (P-type)
MAGLLVSRLRRCGRLMADFICLSSKCKAVIACRVSPDQKRQIVTMMRNHSGQTPPPMALAIGDGVFVRRRILAYF